MRKLFYTLIVFLTFFIGAGTLSAQITLTGSVLDEETNEPMIGANVVVKNTIVGTITDGNGNFKLTVNQTLPVTLEVSSIGYATQVVQVTDAGAIQVKLDQASVLGSEVVVSASRVEEKLLESPVTIEKLDLIAIQQSSSADYYDEILKLKGVHSNQASVTFNTLNTRGFGTAGNTRFVQLMDGMDNAAPLLNFPSGNIVGISELDIANVELVPGAASALYGPNAFNGILLMNSKSPFDYQGLSVQLKQGVMNADNFSKSEPYTQASIRYAKDFNDKFAFKLNFSYLGANDWIADDYTTDRNLLEAAALDPSINTTSSIAQRPNFDGLNTYGDETQIFLPFNAPSLLNPLVDNLTPLIVAGAGGLLTEDQARGFLSTYIPQLNPIQITRTGFEENSILDNREAKSLKGDAALHYRVSDNMEAIFNYRYGQGSTVYQGSERYALRDLVQQFIKLELRGSNYFLRGYTSQTDAGKSYNLTALGAIANEAYSPSATQWVPTYAGNYVGQLMAQFLPVWATNPTLTPGQVLTPDMISGAHQAARAAAEANRPEAGSDAYNQIMDQVRSSYFQRGGASFIDDSNLWHVEGNYDLTEKLNNKLGLQVGGNWRQYDLFTDGTVFNEDPLGSGVNERIRINEFGGYVQASKRLLDDQLKLTASMRYDKNENFDGQVSPRASMVYSVDKERNHNIRLAYQTGFRNPHTQAQFIYFPTTNIIVGGTEANAGRYGIYEGGAYSKSSYDQFQGALLSGLPIEQASALLKESYLDYVQPEQLRSIEFGYKGLIDKKLLLDVSAYFNTYNDFIYQALVVAKQPVVHKGVELPANQVFSAYTNAKDQIKTNGVEAGLTYRYSSKLEFSGNYAYTDISADDNSDFILIFNTPKNRFNLGVSGRKVVDNLGFGVSYRWQDEMYYQSSFGSGMVDGFDVLDLQLSYLFSKANTILKVGATNLLGDNYRTNVGNPFIGQMFYVSLTYDQSLK